MDYRHNARMIVADLPPLSWETIEAMSKAFAERGE
jgi:hypothetical protein